MKGLWAKSNIWILTAAGIAVAAYMALAWDAMPAGQRALGFFVVGIATLARTTRATWYCLARVIWIVA